MEGWLYAVAIGPKKHGRPMQLRNRRNINEKKKNIVRCVARDLLLRYFQ